MFEAYVRLHVCMMRTHMHNVCVYLRGIYRLLRKTIPSYPYARFIPFGYLKIKIAQRITGA